MFNSISRQAEKYVLRKVHAPFRELAVKHSLAPKLDLLGELEGDLTLIADLPALFPLKKLPPFYHILGPLFHQSPAEKTALQTFSRWQNNKKTLLVTVGSSGDIQSLRFLLDKEFQNFNILLVGDAQGYLSASHITSFPFLSLGALLKEVSLMICHGGNGSLYQALQAGIPILCIPTNFEQEWNLQGLEQSNCGERLSAHPRQRMQQIHFWINRKGSEEGKKMAELIVRSSAQDKFKTLLVQFLES